MPWSGGNYTLPSNSFNPAVNGSVLSAGDWNTTASDLAAGVSKAIAKDGQSTTTASIPFALGITLGVGADVLSVYDVATWTPTVTFTTPGTSSIVYTTQNGAYIRIGSLVFLEFSLNFTPTLGTASGDLLIGGLTYNLADFSRASGAVRNINANWTWPTSSTMASLVGYSATTLGLRGSGSGVSGGFFGVSHVTGGAPNIVAGTICYTAA